MTIYERGAKDGLLQRNPALSLYAYWLGILKATYPDGITMRSFATLGQARSWGIAVRGNDHRGRPVIEFGETTESGGVYGCFMLTADGRFRLGHMYGYRKRSAIATHTFMSWGHTASRYQWFVDLNHAHGSNRWSVLDDWQNQHEYISEALMRCNSYYHADHVWLVLEPSKTDGWRLAPAANQKDYGVKGRRGSEPHAAAFEAYAKLRQRRYRRLETQWRRAQGLEPVALSVHPGRVTDGGRAIDPEEAIIQIVALLDVSTPAKTTPLHRGPKEALNGNRLVTTNDA